MRHEFSRGYRAVGFKLMYSHALSQESLLDRLSADRTIRIVHLTRRNLLRRLVSERQAYATNQWGVGRGTELEPRPQIEIAMDDIVNSIQTVERHQIMFNSIFRFHPMLRLVYEDLAEHPLRVAARTAEFLGVAPNPVSRPDYFQKTGTEDLSRALTGFDELRSHVRRWSSFFEV